MNIGIHSPQELMSPQGHDLSVVPPQGYAARPRRRAALAAATNLHEPGLQSKMTQGMRERKQLRALRALQHLPQEVESLLTLKHKLEQKAIELISQNNALLV